MEYYNTFKSNLLTTTENDMTPNLTIRYRGGITFESSYVDTLATILSDVPATPEEQAKGYSPGEILASALGS